MGDGPKIGRFDGNNYDLTRKELRKARKEIQENLGLSKSEAKAQMKEVKNHIKMGDLGEYLDKLGDDMKGAMGLHLTPKMEKVSPKADIDELIQDVKSLDIATVDRKEAFNTMFEANPIAAALAYGPLSEGTSDGVNEYMEAILS